MSSGPGRWSSWALLAALVLAAGCGDGRDGQGPASSATIPAPTTTVAAVSKSCLSAAEQDRVFTRRGYQVLAFDFAGFGDSEHGSAEHRVDTDVVAAAAQLRRRGADDQPFAVQARTLYQAARVRDKRLLVVPGAGHGNQPAGVRR